MFVLILLKCCQARKPKPTHETPAEVPLVGECVGVGVRGCGHLSCVYMPVNKMAQKGSSAKNEQAPAHTQPHTKTNTRVVDFCKLVLVLCGAPKKPRKAKSTYASYK